jgi:two-component system, response regulator YesN
MNSASLNKAMQILIVDDDQIVREFAAHTITFGSNRKVTSFECGFEAWQHIQSNADHIQIVLADKHIPNMDGLELLQCIKKAYPRIVFVIMSSDSSLELKAFQLGADAFVCKPFDVNDLFKIVQNFIPPPA